MTDLPQRVENLILSRPLFKRGQKILVAASGGLDSMVLLHVLEKMSMQHGWKLTIAHFNHQLRGRSSDADEKLVSKTAKAMKLPFVAGRKNVKQYESQSKLSVEMAARKLRHEFFARVARERKIKTMALAHHADDQVELFFLRLLRGAGGEGLPGMKWCSQSPIEKNLTLVRPLLNFTKTELQEFARKNKIRFRDDVSNFSSDFLRNRIRNKLLPLLKKIYQPGLDKTVLRLMEIVGAESNFIGGLAQIWIVRRRPAFEKLPVALQRRVLQLQLMGQKLAVDFELIEQLRGSAGKFVSVNSFLSVSRDLNGDLKLRSQDVKVFKANELPVSLPGGVGKAVFDGVKFSWRLENVKKTERPKHRAGCEFFDAGKLGNGITLRYWRPGDRFQPIGLKSPVKLQDYFMNAKIPRDRRHSLILATTAVGEIFWVEGLRISENFKLTKRTKRRLVWCWKNAG